MLIRNFVQKIHPFTLFLPLSVLLMTAAGTDAAAQDVAAAPAAATPDSAAAAEETSACTDCHDTAAATARSLAKSVHKDMGCTDCHGKASSEHDKETVGKVACGDCHDDVVAIYTEHGNAKVNDPKSGVPKCTDCHGVHDIRPVADPESMVHAAKITSTCASCHNDPKKIKDHNSWNNAVAAYHKGVHSVAAKDGSRPEVAACNDCHATKGNAHRILSTTHADSAVHHFNIPDTCGKCHSKATKDFWTGIHGEYTRRGKADAPVCTDCHGDHAILKHSDSRSPVNSARIASATCTPCHDSARLNKRFSVPTGDLKTYVDTFHGLKSQSGDASVANCASCHNYHDILPSTDPRSTIHANNLQKTCGHCHHNIHQTLASTKIHGSLEQERTGLPAIVRMIYLGLIFGIIGSMIIYIIIDLRRYLLDHWSHSSTHVQRMNANAILQHTLLMASFTTLAITGFALRFSDAWWVELTFGYEGGAPLRGLLHRIAAGILLFGSVYHLIFLFTKTGRKFLFDMLPGLHDITDLIQMMKFNLFKIGSHPHFRRFGYAEKAEYWALIWGTIAMSVSGIIMMYDNWFAQYLSKDILEVVLVIHYYEAWLAVLAIIVWHLYTAVFRPSAYPMNPSWLTGYMSLDMYRHEHGGDLETIAAAEKESAEKKS